MRSFGLKAAMVWRTRAINSNYNQRRAYGALCVARCVVAGNEGQHTRATRSRHFAAKKGCSVFSHLTLHLGYRLALVQAHGSRACAL